MELLAVIAV
ncbi:MAG: hypothetical protein KAZ87_13090 [Spirochaetes bacterium]|nr:hypothetical protein [Spirochaetota bacterium]